jgi:mannosyltransferase OCH1-like enzyme
MIPKIIHYCWFGNGKMTEEMNKCINSWKKQLNDYEIIEWNENSFNVKLNPYVQEAYEKGKYAFVSDYVRLYALKKYGGIYMDTDVEVLKNFEEFLGYSAVFGFESNDRIATAIIMSEKENPVICEWLETYNGRNFMVNGKMDMTTNVKCITNIMSNNGAKLTGKRQILKDGSILLCEKNVFCPYAIGESKKQEFDNSYAVHWCDGSWVSGKVKIKHFFVICLKKILGSDRYYKLKKCR